MYVLFEFAEGRRAVLLLSTHFRCPWGLCSISKRPSTDTSQTLDRFQVIPKARFLCPATILGLLFPVQDALPRIPSMRGAAAAG